MDGYTKQKYHEAIDQVADSIKTFGWQQPIVVDKDMVIIVGETRYKAAKKLKRTPLTFKTCALNFDLRFFIGLLRAFK